jgi:hypothetical protein
VDAKYSWCSIDLAGSYEVGIWKYIRRGWRLFLSHTIFDLGDGLKIKFWDDVWCGVVR